MTSEIQTMKPNQMHIWHVLRPKEKLATQMMMMAAIQMNPPMTISIQMLVIFSIGLFAKTGRNVWNKFHHFPFVEKVEDVADEYDSNVSTTSESEGDSDGSAGREKKKKKKEKKEKKKERREKSSTSSSVSSLFSILSKQIEKFEFFFLKKKICARIYFPVQIKEKEEQRR